MDTRFYVGIAMVCIMLSGEIVVADDPTGNAEHGKCVSDLLGVLNHNNFEGPIDPQARCLSEASGQFKKACPEPFEGFVQQGRSHFCAQSVLPVREHGNMARTSLAAFFNSPMQKKPGERIVNEYSRWKARNQHALLEGRVIRAVQMECPRLIRAWGVGPEGKL